MFCCPLSDWIKILRIVGTIIKTLWDTRAGASLRRDQEEANEPKKNIAE